MAVTCDGHRCYVTEVDAYLSRFRKHVLRLAPIETFQGKNLMGQA